MSTIPAIPYGSAPRAAQYARALTQWDLIVIHDTGHHGSGGSITSAADEAHYAATRTDDRSHWTSAHAYIDAGGPIGSLSLDLQAWAAFSWANGRGIHLEMCGENAGGVAAVPQATIAHTAALVRTVAALKGIPLVKLTPAQLGAAARNGTRVRGVCGHYDISVGLGVGDHDDPGPRFDWSAFIALAAGGGSTSTTMTTTATGTVGDDDMGLNDPHLTETQVSNTERYQQSTVGMLDDVAGVSDTVNSRSVPNLLVKAVKQIAADVAELKARPSATVALSDADRADIAARVLAGIGHVPTAAEDAEEIARRLGNG